MWAMMLAAGVRPRSGLMVPAAGMADHSSKKMKWQPPRLRSCFTIKPPHIEDWIVLAFIQDHVISRSREQ